MSVGFVASENCCNFTVTNCKVLQTIISMLTADKVTELFCIADDFCMFFDAMMGKYTLKSDNKRHYQRDTTMSKAEIMPVMILFHDSGYRCLKQFYIDLHSRKSASIFANSSLRLSCTTASWNLKKEVAVLFGEIFDMGIHFVRGQMADMKNRLVSMWGRSILWKRYIIECVDDLPKDKANTAHPRHRSIHDSIMNTCSVLAAFPFVFPFF